MRRKVVHYLNLYSIKQTQKTMQGISFKRKHLSQLIITALTFSGLSMIASPVVSSTEQPTVIAQGCVCPPGSGGSQFVTAETASFYVYICGGDLPNTYVGVSKDLTKGGIILPLQSYNNDTFVAVSGEYRYTLSRNELIVTRNGKVIVREKATWKF